MGHVYDNIEGALWSARDVNVRVHNGEGRATGWARVERGERVVGVVNNTAQ